MRESINGLDTLWKISGLKINVEKKRVIQIVMERDNRMNLCNNLYLVWQKDMIPTICGTQINIHNKLIEMKSLIAQYESPDT